MRLVSREPFHPGSAAGSHRHGRAALLRKLSGYSNVRNRLVFAIVAQMPMTSCEPFHLRSAAGSRRYGRAASLRKLSDHSNVRNRLVFAIVAQMPLTLREPFRPGSAALSRCYGPNQRANDKPILNPSCDAYKPAAPVGGRKPPLRSSSIVAQAYRSLKWQKTPGFRHSCANTVNVARTVSPGICGFKPLILSESTRE